MVILKQLMRMKKIMFAVVALMAVMAVGCDDDYNAPEATRSEFQTQYPDATHVEWERRRGYVIAEFSMPGVSDDCEAWYTKSGKWIMTEYDIRYSDLPEAVQTAFETAYGKQTPIDDVNRVERNNGSTHYILEVEVVVNGYLTELFLDYAPDGTLNRTEVEIENYDYIYYYLD